MSRQYSSKTAVRILCALFVLIAAAVAAAGPVESVQAQAPAQQVTGGVTDTWAVQISPGTDPDQLALQMGAQNLGQIGALTDYYLFRIPGTDSELTAMADVFAASSQVIWFEQQVARQQSKRVIEDPVYLDQWHLVNANVEPAWTAGFTGTGVNIAIVDDGLQHSHPDLSAQYKAALSHDYNGDFVYPIVVEDGDPEDALDHGDYHGTASAGIAAADYNGNALATSCGVGVAYDAGLSGLRLIAAPSTPDQVARALNFGMNPASPGADFNSIYSNSWGPADDMTEPLVGPSVLELAALQAGVTSGRNGKGSIYVWAAGNGLIDKDNVNYDGYANSRYTIAVGALGNDDTQAPYSEPGAAMLVTAPGGISGPNGIVTTDLLGHFGYSFDTDCTEGNFDGTSASAPIVSGVVALMLDANPTLGWRDVQYILARTAVKNDPTDADWVDNHADLNGGVSFHVNHKYGFGLVDAAAAVAMANPATYINLPRAASVSSGVVVPDIDNQNIPDSVFVDGAYDGVFSTYNVTHEMTVEHVEVVFKSSENLNQEPPGTGGYRGDLRIVLTSPSGTVSVLSEPHGDSAPDYDNWKFMTVRNWGESSLGEWTLRVTDEKGGGVSVFDSWQLILHGTGLTADIDVTIGGDLKGSYTLLSGQENREYYNVSGGPVIVESLTGTNIVSAIRLQVMQSGTLYSFVETMGVPVGLLSDTYYFPTYNNTFPPLNSQVRFGNLSTTASTRIRVTIGGAVVWEDDVPAQEERRLYFDVSGGPVIIESLDGTKIVAAIRLQVMQSGTLYSFSETMGVPKEFLSDKYYFPTYNNTFPPLNSQVRFGNLSTTASTRIRVTIGGAVVWENDVPAQEERRLIFNVSGGPVIIESLDGTNIVAAIRLQVMQSGTLYSFVETMGVPVGLLSDTYYFPTYNNTFPPLNSQVRFGNLSTTASTRIRVTIGGAVVWEDDVPAQEERRLYFNVSGGPVIIESLDGTKIVAAIRLQVMQSGTLYSFSETMGIPKEFLSGTYYFPTYNNTFPPLNSQLRFGVP